MQFAENKIKNIAGDILNSRFLSFSRKYSLFEFYDNMIQQKNTSLNPLFIKAFEALIVSLYIVTSDGMTKQKGYDNIRSH